MFLFLNVLENRNKIDLLDKICSPDQNYTYLHLYKQYTHTTYCESMKYHVCRTEFEYLKL